MPAPSTSTAPPRSRAEHRTVTWPAHLLVAWIFITYPRPQGLNGTVLLLGTLACWGLTVVMVRPVQPRRAIPLLPVAIVAAAGLSSFWTIDVHATIQSAAALGAALLACTALPSRLAFADLVITADRCLKACVVASLLVYKVAPEIGTTVRDVNAGTLRGIYEHRNGMGYVVVIALITYIARWHGTRRHATLQYWGWLGVLLICLVLAESAGAFLLGALTLSIYAVATFSNRQLTHLGQRGHLLLGALGCFALAAVALLATDIQGLIDALGRRDSIDSRLEIWRGAWDAWQTVLWHGYGWGSVINGDEATLSRVSVFAGYDVRSVHDGYLSTALQLGLIGVVLTVAYLVTLLVGSYRLVFGGGSQFGLWAALIVTALALGDVVENRAFVNIGWALLALVAVYLRESRDSATSSAMAPTRKTTAP